MPPTCAAARKTYAGRSASKKRSTSACRRRSSSLCVRTTRFWNPAASSLRSTALPTSPRWPATKTLSALFTAPASHAERVPGLAQRLLLPRELEVVVRHRAHELRERDLRLPAEQLRRFA